MNVLLWRAEFGGRGGDTPVPLELVWRKILTAPDASSLSVYQKGDRMGYCEVSTGVGQQMASFEEGKPPPEGFASHAGFLLHIAGNISVGDFTNRIKFDGRVSFNPQRQWQEINFRITSRLALVEIHSLATNGTAHLKLMNDGTPLFEREATFAELQNPGSLLHLLAGGTVADFLDAPDMAALAAGSTAQKMEWDARRTRVQLGSEAVPVYRLETSFLGRPIVVDVSTLGEILRVDLPGDINARIDEWNKP